jgi:hypothetical protein
MQNSASQEWTVDITDADIDAALERAKSLPPEPHAVSGEYNRDLDLIILRLDNGRRVVLPREQMQGLQNATEAQLAHIEIFGGTDIAWPDLDVDHHLPSLLAGRYGSDKWMRSLQDQHVAA